MRGETSVNLNTDKASCNFNPLPSCEGRPLFTDSLSSYTIFQSTPLMRGETLQSFRPFRPSSISIHSPHARGDDIHSLFFCKDRDFNPLPSCEGRRDVYCEIVECTNISIHSPHARGDILFSTFLILFPRFQSTPLMRGETIAYFFTPLVHAISIHSPHARGDFDFNSN